MNEVYVQIKQVYGNRVIYPACTKAQHFADIAGTKTLTMAAIQHIKCLGFEVKVQQEVVQL